MIEINGNEVKINVVVVACKLMIESDDDKDNSITIVYSR